MSGETMLKRPWIVAAVVAGLAGAVAWACGPMFPNQLLDQRSATLKSVPQNSFAFEAQHLLPAMDTLVADEPPPYGGDDKKGDDAEAKSLGVSVAQLARIKALRELHTGDEAFDQGKDLPTDAAAIAAAKQLAENLSRSPIHDGEGSVRVLDSAGRTVAKIIFGKSRLAE